LNGEVKPGDPIAIFGAGPISMASLLTTQFLFNNVQSGKLDPKKLITHHFKLEQIIQAYNTFEHASKEKALKVILTN